MRGQISYNPINAESSLIFDVRSKLNTLYKLDVARVSVTYVHVSRSTVIWSLHSISHVEFELKRKRNEKSVFWHLILGLKMSPRILDDVYNLISWQGHIWTQSHPYAQSLFRILYHIIITYPNKRLDHDGWISTRSLNATELVVKLIPS